MEYKLIALKLPMDLVQAIEVQAASIDIDKSALVIQALKQAFLARATPASLEPTHPN